MNEGLKKMKSDAENDLIGIGIFKMKKALDWFDKIEKASREEAYAELENGTLIVCDCCGKVKGYKGALGNTCEDCI